MSAISISVKVNYGLSFGGAEIYIITYDAAFDKFFYLDFNLLSC